MTKINDLIFGTKNDFNNNIDLALFLIRISLAATFIVHGWAKVTNIDGTIGFFTSLGFSAIFAYVVAYVEILGGIAILAGVLTRITGVAFAVIMVVAIFSVHFKNGFNNMTGGYEFNLLLLACSLAVALVGPGKLSVEKYLSNK